MQFHNYLEKTIGSKVKVKILRALFRHPSKKFTARELAASISATHTPVLRSLGDLQGMNLIRLEKHGTANVLELNTACHLHPILKDLFSFEQQTLEHAVNRLKTALPPVEMAALFGSLQTGTEQMDSDIDIIIVTEDKAKTENELDAKHPEIIKEFGNLISPIILNLHEFKRKKDTPFAKDLAKNYTLIKGKDLIARYWLDGKN